MLIDYLRVQQDTRSTSEVFMDQHVLYLASPGPNRQQVILWLRQRSGLSLAECRQWADTSRAELTRGPAFKVAAIAEELEELSAVVFAEPPLPKIPMWQRTPPLPQVREQHYRFAHCVLVDFFCEDAKRLWELLTNAHADHAMLKAWDIAGRGAPSLIDPAGLKRCHERLKAGEAVIIKLPEPKSITEAHLVALVRISARKSFFRKAQPKCFRYFTLEQGMDIQDLRGLLIFCEWLADGAHLNYEECSVEPDIIGFKAFIDDVLCNKNILRIRARTTLS
jgi:hypothetical protein